MNAMGSPSREERMTKALQAQHGVITRDQLRACGFSDRQVQLMTDRGRIVRVHPATYIAADVRTTWETRVEGAALSMGDEWMATRRTAARLLELDDCRSNVIELVGTTSPKRRTGVTLHRTGWLPRLHRCRVKGIPATSATRTLLDLGNVVTMDALEIALESAIRLGLTSEKFLEAQLSEYAKQGRRGCAAIGELLALRKGFKTTDSAFETKLFQVLRDAKLPLPQRQIPVYENEVFLGRPDFLYPEARVAIEAFSRRHHAGFFRGEKDAVRRNRLQAAGYVVIEVSYKRLRETPNEVVDEIAKALGIRLS
jgi:very-short-patch-repair endonuclease